MNEHGTLSEDEIREKMDFITRKIFQAQVAGSSAEIVDQLIDLQSAYQYELDSRMEAEVYKMWNSQFPDVIISDQANEPAGLQNPSKAINKQKIKSPNKFDKVFRDK